MKITKSQLKQIIKEELEGALNEAPQDPPRPGEDDHALVTDALKKDEDLTRLAAAWAKRAEAIINGLEHPEGHSYKAWALGRKVDTGHSHDWYALARVFVPWAKIVQGGPEVIPQDKE